MSTTTPRLQRGQAMTEFVAAMAVLLPLFFGIVYLAKFGDIKHQAIQASRFAAFERAQGPRQVLDATIAEEARQRFFTDLAAGGGKIGNRDSTVGIPTAGTLNPNWNTVNNRPLIQNYSDIQVDFPQSGSLSIGAFAPVELASRPFNHLNRDGKIEADIRVSLANILHLPAPLNNLNLMVAATTVVAGDAWNGGGANDVANQQTGTDLPGNALQVVNALLSPFYGALTDAAPTFGCVKPDVVPDQSAPGAVYKPSDPCL
jgi:Flp pilus assembly protein TadG